MAEGLVNKVLDRGLTGGTIGSRGRSSFTLPARFRKIWRSRMQIPAIVRSTGEAFVNLTEATAASDLASLEANAEFHAAPLGALKHRTRE